VLSYIGANSDAPCSINLIDTAGVFTYTIFSNPGTLASGGTAITTKPSIAELAKNAKDARKILWGAVASCISDRAAND